MNAIRQVCPTCNTRLVIPVTAAGKSVKCSKCGARVTVEPEPTLELREIPPAVERPKERIQPPLAPDSTGVTSGKTYVQSIGTFFTYPFSGIGGLLFLALVTPFWAALRADVVPFGWILKFILGGWIAAYMFSVLFDTSMGKNTAPASPPMTDLYELVGQFFRFFGATFVAFAPAVGLMAAWGLNHSGPALSLHGAFASPLFVVLYGSSLLFGILFYPMALMLMGFSESYFTGFNYVFGVRSILRIRKDYLICCVFFVATFAGGALLEVFLVAATEGSLATRLVAYCITTFIELYLYVVQMRALGILYVSNKERLAWFR